MVIKGIMGSADAMRAVEEGVDGIVLRYVIKLSFVADSGQESKFELKH